MSKVLPVVYLNESIFNTIIGPNFLTKGRDWPVESEGLKIDVTQKSV